MPQKELVSLIRIVRPVSTTDDGWRCTSGLACLGWLALSAAHVVDLGRSPVEVEQMQISLFDHSKGFTPAALLCFLFRTIKVVFVLEQAFLEEEADEEFPDIAEEEEDDMETLVEIDGELYKEKEVEIEVSDSEAGSDAESDAGPQDGCGVKRKRTIRVVIRSRAFI